MTLTGTGQEHNRALDGLEAVLQGIEGVRYVDRNTLPELTSDKQIPAIIIHDRTWNYDWLQRHGYRMSYGAAEELRARLVAVVELELIAVSRRQNHTRKGWNRSVVRSAFVREVIRTLAQNPMLECQLDGEAEAVYHAKDTLATGASARSISAVPDPYVTAVIQIQIELEEHFGPDVDPTWHNIVCDIYPYDPSAV